MKRNLVLTERRFCDPARMDDGKGLRLILDRWPKILVTRCARATRASFKVFQQVFGETGITPAQYSALLVIELNPGLR